MKKFLTAIAIIIWLVGVLYLAVAIHDAFLWNATDAAVVSTWGQSSQPHPEPVLYFVLTLCCAALGGFLWWLSRIVDRFEIFASESETPAASLAADLGMFSFVGVSLGQAVHRLRVLGLRAEKRGATETWTSDGLSAVIEDNVLRSYSLFWTRTADWKKPLFKPYAGIVRWRGRVLEWTNGTTESDIRSVMGVPYWRADKRSEPYVRLFFEHGDVEVVCVLEERAGTAYLTSVHVVSPPTFSHPEVRAAYGCTKPWTGPGSEEEHDAAHAPAEPELKATA